jgi:hypothetical protein
MSVLKYGIVIKMTNIYVYNMLFLWELYVSEANPMQPHLHHLVNVENVGETWGKIILAS